MLNTKRLAIIEGVRTPFAKAGTDFKAVAAPDLGQIAFSECLQLSGLRPGDIDLVIAGCGGQPADAMNIARVVALYCGIPNTVPAYTVQRNCASGMEAITSAWEKIMAGQADIVLAGGIESMSSAPLMYNRQMLEIFEALSRAKTLTQRLSALARIRPAYVLNPVISIQQGLTDPVSGMIMGDTAEILAREFGITRTAQDAYALASHNKALAAQAAGRLAEEIVAVKLPPDYKSSLGTDNGPREGQSLEKLGKLRPFFDKKNGTVTVGNACPVTDGAAAVMVMTEARAKALGIKPLGYLRAYAYAGLDPERMGLGPVYATHKLLQRTGFAMSNFDLVELNEAFAVQVLACQAAFGSDQFAKKYLNASGKVGELNMDKLNVNGGAIALGHPPGATGVRLVITILKELARRGQQHGLATLCVGGGQGAALHLEVE